MRASPHEYFARRRRVQGKLLNSNGMERDEYIKCNYSKNNDYDSAYLGVNSLLFS